jgi:hypothetical protein
MKKYILLLLPFVFVAWFWIVIIPLWHFPDEQAHFGQVAFLAQNGRNSAGNENDLTKEIFESEVLLGTNRDQFGNNKFTFHPEYKIPYSNSNYGIYESSISALNTPISKTTYVRQESPRYPISYYLPASFIYNLLYSQDLFIRVYAIRVWSLFLYIIHIFILYKLGKVIFQDKLYILVFMCMVGLQPMFVFSNVGVNSDAVGNLLFSLYVYLSSKIFVSKITKTNTLLLLATIVLGIYSKPQFIIVIPITFILFTYIYFRDLYKKNVLKKIILYLLCVIILSGILFLMRNTYLSILGLFIQKINISSLWKFTLEYTLPHTIKEVLPWYWGIYDWLGVTYPRFVHRIINRILIVAIIGFVWWFIRGLMRKDYAVRNFQLIIYFMFINIFFFISISFYDWLSWYTSGYQLGVQGRYFFPVISLQMSFIFIGLSQILPKKFNIKEIGIKIIGILFILLNVYGIITVTKTYYDLSSYVALNTQVSQYKPWIAKGTFLYVWFSCYILSLILISIKIITHKNNFLIKKGRNIHL